MVDRAVSRLREIRESISEINELLAGRTFADLNGDRHRRAPFERYLEIISEASRHLPDELKAQEGAETPWRDIAALGNRIRHEYRLIDIRILWSIYENDLDPLERADAILAAINR